MQEKSKPVDNLRADAEKIITRAIAAVLPDAAVERALKGKTFLGRVYLVAAGKAAWQMAHAARACLQDNFCGGVVVTKYGHVKGEIADVACFEGGHPVPDENSLRGTDAALALTEDLTESDTVVFLLSGGGSALFEKPLLPLAELQDVTNQLLAAGADIVEINTIRKRLSAVKGGRFARHCAPAQVFAVVLSDILGDRPDSIASGPACADASTVAEAFAISEKYKLKLTEEMRKQLAMETPKTLANVTMEITGSVTQLCADAARAAEQLGYTPLVLTNMLDCEAWEAGRFLASIAKTIRKDGLPLRPPCAILCGGETVVHITGKGKGGRNQELALAAAERIAGMEGRPMPQAVLWTGKPAVSLRKRAYPFLRFLRRTIPMPHWRRQMPFSSQEQPAQT